MRAGSAIQRAAATSKDEIGMILTWLDAIISDEDAATG
jgi:hypothetical protein